MPSRVLRYGLLTWLLAGFLPLLPCCLFWSPLASLLSKNACTGVRAQSVVRQGPAKSSGINRFYHRGRDQVANGDTTSAIRTYEEGLRRYGEKARVRQHPKNRDVLSYACRQLVEWLIKMEELERAIHYHALLAGKYSGYHDCGNGVQSERLANDLLLSRIHHAAGDTGEELRILLVAAQNAVSNGEEDLFYARLREVLSESPALHVPLEAALAAAYVIEEPQETSPDDDLPLVYIDFLGQRISIGYFYPELTPADQAIPQAVAAFRAGPLYEFLTNL